MRDKKRINQILGTLALIWEENPDLRLGQIIGNALILHDGPSVPLYYVEDDVTLECLKKHLTQIKDETLRP